MGLKLCLLLRIFSFSYGVFTVAVGGGWQGSFRFPPSSSILLSDITPTGDASSSPISLPTVNRKNSSPRRHLIPPVGNSLVAYR